MNRTKFVVHVGPDTARFSSFHHALLFGAMISERRPGWIIEVSAKDGLVGQYLEGKPTPEFRQHHISGLFT